MLSAQVALFKDMNHLEKVQTRPVRRIRYLEGGKNEGAEVKQSRKKSEVKVWVEEGG